MSKPKSKKNEWKEYHVHYAHNDESCAKTFIFDLVNQAIKWFLDNGYEIKGDGKGTFTLIQEYKSFNYKKHETPIVEDENLFNVMRVTMFIREKKIKE